MVETGMLRQRFVGVAPLGYVISFWIKGDIMVWSPDILPMLMLQIYYTLWLLLCDRDPGIKVGNDRGMT